MELLIKNGTLTIFCYRKKNTPAFGDFCEKLKWTDSCLACPVYHGFGFVFKGADRKANLHGGVYCFLMKGRLCG